MQINELDMTKLSVQYLRQNGFKVRVNHFRFYNIVQNYDTLKISKNLFSNKAVENYRVNFGRQKVSNMPLVCGGQTRLDISTPGNKEYSVRTECSIKDGYSRKRGVSICLGRFRKLLEQENHATD